MLLPSLPLCLLIMWRLAHVNSSKDDGFEGNGEKSDWVWVLRGAAGGEPPSYSIQASLLCHTTQDPTGEEVWVCVSWGWSREQMDNTAQSAMKPCLWSVFFKAEGPSELRIRQLLCPCPQVCGVCECLWCVCVFCESHSVVIHFISWERRLLSYSDSEIYQSFFLIKVYS